MIEAGPSSPLYLAGNMHREPGHTRVSAFQVQYLDEKFGWRTSESFESSYGMQIDDAFKDSHALADRLTEEGKAVRIVTCAVTIESTLVWGNPAAREHEKKRQELLAEYEVAWSDAAPDTYVPTAPRDIESGDVVRVDRLSDDLEIKFWDLVVRTKIRAGDRYRLNFDDGTYVYVSNRSTIPKRHP